MAAPKTVSDTTKAKLAYCDTCSPKVAIGWGAFPANAPLKHAVNGQVHDGKTMDMASNEPMNLGETPGDFLVRMGKKYLK